MSMDDYPGRSRSWHKAGRSSRLAETGDRLCCQLRRSPEQRGEEQKQDKDQRMVSGKIEREAEQDKRVERGACVRIRKKTGRITLWQHS